MLASSLKKYHELIRLASLLIVGHIQFSNTLYFGMDYHGWLEVVPFEWRPRHEHGQTDPQVVPNKYEGLEAVKTESGIQDVPVLGRNNTGLHQPGTDPASEKDRKCGLPMRVFYTSLVIAIIIALGAVAGGVVAGIKSSQNKAVQHTNDVKNETVGSDQPAKLNKNILAESRLAASNWTDPNGFAHRFVFFQDPSSAIIARRWDSQNQTWVTNNVTAIMSSSRGPISSLGPSTPLASGAVYYQNISNEIQLVYLTPRNTVAAVGLNTLAERPNDWTTRPISGVEHVTAPGSQLASGWNRCLGENCGRGTWVVLYQDPDGAVKLINESDYLNPIIVMPPQSVAQNSSLAIMAEVDFQVPTNGLTRLSVMSESLRTPDSGNVWLTTIYYKQIWTAEEAILGGRNLPPPTPRVQFAISALDNFNTPVFMSLLPNGTVIGEIYRSDPGHWLGIPSAEFRGGPPNIKFSSIAATEEAMFYGISDDQILQYSISNTDPPKFDYVGRVYP
ncbi:hypothetical protein F5Y14DRAFT_196549 [Nemania sp. NC0429]|nr:hypothetical protein F5Y14DRAFT_196549 [Nemania sp. NC0429]